MKTLANVQLWDLIFPFIISFVCTQFAHVEGYLYYRRYQKSTSRNMIPHVNDPTLEHDTVSVDLYLRNYLTGPLNEQFAFFNYDSITAYVGPQPIGAPEKLPNGSYSSGRIRTWAMFDDKTRHSCYITAIYDYGQVVMFTCREPGMYRAYAYEVEIEAGVLPDASAASVSGYLDVSAWIKIEQKLTFDFLRGKGIPDFQGQTVPIDERIDKMLEYARVKPSKAAISDPVVIKKSFYCYYWMYHLVEKARVGYIGKEVMPSFAEGRGNGSSYLLLELLIWIAEPVAVYIDEASDDIETTSISEYSKLLTDRFSSVGLFPCLRKAHSVIEVVSEMVFVRSSDQSNPIKSSPHWRALLKIHTDRLISTLTDVTFTIASRQNTGLFNCFVGDTRAFVNVRAFEFVRRGKLEMDSLNLEFSNLWGMDKTAIKHQLKHIYGHGVQYVGYKWSKIYQPATSRTDMVIISNPCMAQEFAFSVGGSLYVGEGLLQKGEIQAKMVRLPEFKDPSSRLTNPEDYRNYLRVLDMAFTPTHFVILMSDGDVILHTTSLSQKGIGRLTNLKKYQPAALVKRRWCARTSTPKMSTMMVPIFGRGGSIVVLQVYPTEGSVRMWVRPLSTYCISEGIGFVTKSIDQRKLINETDIHYNEFVAIKRSNHKTGLMEKSLDPRPEPPSQPPPNLEDKLSYLLDGDVIIEDGKDPHFPPEYTNPATHALSSELSTYNHARVYVLDEDKRSLTKTLLDNGISNVNSGTGSTDEEISLYTVEFTAVEKQFIVAARFTASEIPDEFSKVGDTPPFQMLITTVTVTNFPFKVRLNLDIRAQDEILETIILFPGVILMRSKPFTVGVENIKSRDPEEEKEHIQQLAGRTKVEYAPEISTMNTAIPSYVINFGDVLVYTSLEGRYGRPLHYFSWEYIDRNLEAAALADVEPETLIFSNSDIIFAKDANTSVRKGLYDAVVTEQGIISVLWRQVKRHQVQDDELCQLENDAVGHQTAAVGSVVTLEGLREIKPFFKNDNIFQKATPDGEVIYGNYEVAPHSPFLSCPEDRSWTANDVEVCIEQATEPLDSTRPLLPVCAPDFPPPCRDPAYLQDCDIGIPRDPKHACLRLNRFARHCSERHEESGFPPPTITDPATCDQREEKVTGCLPTHAPRVELRSVHMLGTPFLSYVLGSLNSIKSQHPEAPDPGLALPTDPKEPNVCPFTSFLVFNTDFDFAEVGYETRITGIISYLGRGVPTEADLIIEYENRMGIVIEITSSIEEERDLTTIKKTIDFQFKMTDYTLAQFRLHSDVVELGNASLSFEDIRARENTTVFSITLRPSIVNMRCKNTDFFKTIQFNVGCNAFSKIRLLSEASPLKRINWTEMLQSNSDEFRWYKDNSTDDWNLTIPSAHIHNHQLKLDMFKCIKENSSKTFPKFCRIPFFKYFEDEIFTVSYRDYVFPQFEQFLTVSSRRVSGNMIIYDLLGSKDFNVTVNKLKAGCYSGGNFWYDKLLNTTKIIDRGSTVHENIYKHYEDCFDVGDATDREPPFELHASPFNIFNLTNKNRIKFRRNRNQIFIFRAVLVNTYFNRFTYCKLLDTFFMVRVTGIPIPRQGLFLWHYVVVMFSVSSCFILSYFIFYKFYTWKLHLGNQPEMMPHTEHPLPWSIEARPGSVESDHFLQQIAERGGIPATRSQFNKDKEW